MLDNDLLKVAGGAVFGIGATVATGFMEVLIAERDIATTLAEPVGFLVTLPFILALLGFTALHLGNDQGWGDMPSVQQALTALPVGVLVVHQWQPNVNELIAGGDPAVQGVTAFILVGTGLGSAFAGKYL